MSDGKKQIIWVKKLRIKCSGHDTSGIIHRWRTKIAQVKIKNCSGNASLSFKKYEMFLTNINGHFIGFALMENLWRHKVFDKEIRKMPIIIFSNDIRHYFLKLVFTLEQTCYFYRKMRYFSRKLRWSVLIFLNLCGIGFVNHRQIIKIMQLNVFL